MDGGAWQAIAHGVAKSRTPSRWQALGVGDGQRCLVCYSPWDQKVLDTTEQLNRTKLKNHKNAN